MQLPPGVLHLLSGPPPPDSGRMTLLLSVEVDASLAAAAVTEPLRSAGISHAPAASGGAVTQLLPCCQLLRSADALAAVASGSPGSSGGRPDEMPSAAFKAVLGRKGASELSSDRRGPGMLPAALAARPLLLLLLFVLALLIPGSGCSMGAETVVRLLPPRGAPGSCWLLVCCAAASLHVLLVEASYVSPSAVHISGASHGAAAVSAGVG